MTNVSNNDGVTSHSQAQQ